MSQKKERKQSRKITRPQAFKYPTYNQAGERVPYTFTVTPAPVNDRSFPVRGYRLERDGQISDVMMKWSTACKILRALGASRIVPVMGYKDQIPKAVR